MDLAIGAMGSLLPKVVELLKEEYKLQKSAKADLEYLQTELKSIDAALSDVAKLPRNQITEQHKLWASDIRELSQDIEDLVESFLVSAEGASVPPADPDCFKVIMAKVSRLFKMAKARRKIAAAAKDVKAEVCEVASRADRYRERGGGGAALVTAAAAAATQPANTINHFLNLKVRYRNRKIIGMDAARDEITKKLCEGGDASAQQPKVLSIVGFGGLGKTTLAKAVYDSLLARFDCGAFVSLSRTPDWNKVFKDLLYQLDKEKYSTSGASALDLPQLIPLLQETLQTKRYFIVIDDIWDPEAWENINLAFEGTNSGSRIITTTRNQEVCKACCPDGDLIHEIKHLSEKESITLFYEGIFGSETGCPQWDQVDMDILKKCGGVPLAINTLASYLADKEKDQWPGLLQSIGHGLSNGVEMDGMKKILLLSYYDLPSHLKACFLYLSIFPEDSQISKERLIRRWIAEGFLQGHDQQGMSLLGLGESFFNKLINRSLIEPINIDDEGRAEACRVHDIMLDMICGLSSKENFVTVLDRLDEDKPLDRKVRRLTLQKCKKASTNTQLATTSMSQVRSFTIFPPAFGDMLPLSRFKVLRVLDLEGCEIEESQRVNLGSVGNLLHLRYLGLRGTRLGLIPSDIGKLLFLQILDLHGVSSTALPASVLGLGKLICLNLNEGTELPAGFGNLTSLEELTEAKLRSYGDDIEELRNLTELRALAFSMPFLCDAEKQLILVESLGKLRKLRSLEIRGSTLHGRNIDQMRGWVPPPHLRRLMLKGLLLTLPAWVSSSFLPLVSYLDIHVSAVLPEDIQILGTLPALCYLHLQSSLPRSGASAMVMFMLPAEAFPRVTECCFQDVPLVPVFSPGAMPMVRHLRFRVRVSDILERNYDLNIRNFPSLERLIIDLTSDRYRKYDEAEVALERVSGNHPNPGFQLDIRSGYVSPLFRKLAEDHMIQEVIPSEASTSSIVQDSTSPDC